MQSLGFDVLPTAGNFLHVAFGAHAQAINAVLSAKVYYRAAFDNLCLAGYSRFSVAPKPVMEKVADLIRQTVLGKKA